MRLFLFLFVFAGALLLPAQKAFTIEEVLRSPFSSSPVAAPKGARIAWIENKTGARNIWVADGPEWKGRRLTAFDKDDGQDIAELSWTSDGETLLFARGGDFENGGENPNPDLSPTRPDQSLWSVSVKESKPHRLTEGRAPAASPVGRSVAFIKGGQIYLTDAEGANVQLAVQSKGTLEGLQWSPDGARFAFVISRRDHSFIGLYSVAAKSLEFIDASTGTDAYPSWSPNGTKLAYVRMSPQTRPFLPRREGQPWSIRVFDMRSHEARQVFCADAGPGSVFHGLATEEQLFWQSDEALVFPWEKTGWLHLYRITAGGGLAEDLTRGEGEVEHVTHARDGRRLWYSTNIGDIDRRHIWRIDGGGSGTRLTSGEGIEWMPTAPAEGNEVIALASSYNEKAHAIVVRAGGEKTSLTPAVVAAASLVKPEAVSVTAADGMVLHGQLFRPPAHYLTTKHGTAEQEERHPALIFFHGGSRRQMLLGFHYMYYYSNAYAMNQFLAQQGYVVLSVNYRSGIGYGLNFREAVNYGPSGGSEYADVIGAGLYLKNRPDVDARRIGVWGGSYGGYLTAMALARASNLFTAGVDFHGVHDWSTLRNFDIVGGDPASDEQARTAARVAFESSPMASVKQWRSPVLLIHGDDDRNVAFAQTVTLAAALERQGIEFQELIFPNEIHDFLEHKHWVQAYEATAAFFDKHLGHAGR